MLINVFNEYRFTFFIWFLHYILFLKQWLDLKHKRYASRSRQGTQRSQHENDTVDHQSRWFQPSDYFQWEENAQWLFIPITPVLGLLSWFRHHTI